MRHLFVPADQKSPKLIWGAFLDLIEKREERWVGEVSSKASSTHLCYTGTSSFFAKIELDE
jgi:hypothetical protein